MVHYYYNRSSSNRQSTLKNIFFSLAARDWGGIYSVAATQRGIRTLRGSERVTQAESRRASRVRGFAIFVVEVLVPLRYNVFIKTKT